MVLDVNQGAIVAPEGFEPLRYIPRDGYCLLAPYPRLWFRATTIRVLKVTGDYKHPSRYPTPEGPFKASGRRTTDLVVVMAFVSVGPLNDPLYSIIPDLGYF